MCIASIICAGTLAGALAFAAGRSESITYRDGNLVGVTPHSGGTLVSGDKELQLKTGLATVTVPYESISKTELSAPQEHSNGAPLYKVWALPKRFGKTETQLLTVNFKDSEGEARTMTLELGTSPASSVVATIKKHNESAEAATTAATGKPTTIAKAELAPKRRGKAESKSEPEARQENAKPEASTAAESKDGWWGDRYWKTKSNTEKWGKSSANAPE